MSRFSDEVLLHSQQRHPNIVQLMGVYYPRRSQLPMLIMEYLPFTLTQCLERKELPLQMKYSILLDIAKGVCYLHGKRPPIVHRDLTANNVLLTSSSYTAKISDLGVSRLIDTFRKQHLTTAPGNHMVMPPEALKDKPVYDHKLDVFSYGCLILHVLTGQFPQPTDQFIPGKMKFFYTKVPEWDRRSKYIQQIPRQNELLPLAKRCLNDLFVGRPEMIDCHQFVERILLKHPKTQSAIELIREKEAANRELQELAEKYKILEVENLEKERLKIDNERLATDLKNMSSQVTDFSCLLSLREKEFNDCSEVLKETIRNRDEQLIRTQQDNMTILKKKEDELRELKEEHSVALSKIKKEFEAKITKIKEEYEKEHSATAKKFEQQLSKTREDCEVRVADVMKEFTGKSSEALENAMKSKNKTISFLLPRVSVVNPSYQTQKELIQPLLAQRLDLKKGDKW